MTGAIPLNSCNSSSMIFGEIICDNSRILVADLVLVNFHSFETDDFAAFFVIGLLFIDNYIFKDPYRLRFEKACQFYFWEDGDAIITSVWFYLTCLIVVIDRKTIWRLWTCYHA